MESKSNTGNLPVRPILALLISVSVCVLVGGYQLFVNTLPKGDVTEFVTTAATGDYAIEVTLSFEAKGDAFDPTAILIRLDGRDLLEQTDSLPAGIPLRIHPVEGLIVGLNELFIQVGTADSQQDAGFAKEDEFAEAGVQTTDSLTDEFGLPIERNEFGESDSGAQFGAKAIRVRVFDGDTVLIEKTVWSEPGESISSSIVIDLPANDMPASNPDSDHDHDH